MVHSVTDLRVRFGPAAGDSENVEAMKACYANQAPLITTGCVTNLLCRSRTMQSSKCPWVRMMNRPYGPRKPIPGSADASSESSPPQPSSYQVTGIHQLKSRRLHPLFAPQVSYPLDFIDFVAGAVSSRGVGESAKKSRPPGSQGPPRYVLCSRSCRCSCLGWCSCL
jgi:hypothetical protein